MHILFLPYFSHPVILLSYVFYCELLSIYSKTSPQLIQYSITFSHLFKASYSDLRSVISEATFCSVLYTPLPPKPLGQALPVSLCKICLNTCPFPESLLSIFSLPYIMCLLTPSLYNVCILNIFPIIQMSSILLYLRLENPILLPVSHPLLHVSDIAWLLPSLFSFFVSVSIFILQTRKHINFSAEASNLDCSFTVYRSLLDKDRHLKLYLHNVAVYPICCSWPHI